MKIHVKLAPLIILLFITACGGGGGGDAANSSANIAPVANAGTAQSIVVSTLVTLDGSASSDSNGDVLSYAWSLISKPAGSTATINNSTAANPTFTADLAGNYIAALVVNDGRANSAPTTVTITATSPRITTTMSGSYSVNSGTIVDIDDSTLVLTNGNVSKWTLTTRPAGSQAVVFNDQSSAISSPVTPYFQTDVPGLYAATLQVANGSGISTISIVYVTAM